MSFNPWDTTPQHASSGQSSSTTGGNTSSDYFDPFGSFADEPATAPAPVQQIQQPPAQQPTPVHQQPTFVPTPVFQQPIAPLVQQPLAPVAQGDNNPFASLTTPQQPAVLTSQQPPSTFSFSNNPPPQNYSPPPASANNTTTVAFSSDFMDLLNLTPHNTQQQPVEENSSVATALDDFFGTPAPSHTATVTAATSSNTGSTPSTVTISNVTAAPSPNTAQTPVTAPATTVATGASATEEKPKPTAPRSAAKAMTAEEKEKENEILRSFEMKGSLEKLSPGMLGESWKPKWVTFKTNRFAYYELKTDPRPKYYVYLDESEVGLPKTLTQSYDYNHTFQLTNERKGITWYFRTPGSADLKRWSQAFAASIKYYQERNSETTIYERLLLMACVRYRSVEQYRSFNFYTSKQSTGSYAIAACILLELLLRRCIDITVNENVILHSEVRYQGLGVLDDTLDLLSQKLRMQREFRLSEFIPMLLCSSSFVFGDLSLDAPVLRCIDSAVRRGTLKKGANPKDWHVANLTLEDDLIKSFHNVSHSKYEGTDVREHATLGICYTVMRALCKTDIPVQDVLDRGKIFPELQTRSQVENALDSMAHNLGAFDKKHSIVLKTVYSQLVQFITGGGQYQPQAAR